MIVIWVQIAVLVPIALGIGKFRVAVPETAEPSAALAEAVEAKLAPIAPAALRASVVLEAVEVSVAVVVDVDE